MRRVEGHRSGRESGFVKRYNLDRLIYFEQFDRINDAVARETQLKHWNRAWKVDLIEEQNPGWDDLFLRVNR